MWERLTRCPLPLERLDQAVVCRLIPSAALLVLPLHLRPRPTLAPSGWMDAVRVRSCLPTLSSTRAHGPRLSGLQETPQGPLPLRPYGVKSHGAGWRVGDRSESPPPTHTHRGLGSQLGCGWETRTSGLFFRSAGSQEECLNPQFVLEQLEFWNPKPQSLETCNLAPVILDSYDSQLWILGCGNLRVLDQRLAKACFKTGSPGFNRVSHWNLGPQKY